MANEQSLKRYDLEERTYQFAQDVRARISDVFRISSFGFRISFSQDHS